MDSYRLTFHPHSTNRVVKRFKQNRTERKKSACSWYEDMDEFLSRTTIPGIAQWRNHESMVWKVIWVSVTVVGLVIATYQSLDALRGYWDNAIVQVISFNFKKQLIFPALTICTNLLVDMDQIFFQRDSEIRKLILESDAQIDESKNLSVYELQNIITKYRNRIMSEIMERDVNDAQIPVDIANFFLECNWKWKNCTNLSEDLFQIRYHLRYGNCITFNPGFCHKEQAKANEAFTAILRMNLRSRIHLVNPNYAILIIHPTSAPPIPTPQNMIRLLPGQGVQISITGKNVRRDEVKSIQYCVANEFVQHEHDFYYTPQTPYNYSKIGCYASCSYGQLLKNKTNPCIDPEMPLVSLLKTKKEFTNLSLCPYTENIFSTNPFLANCNCHELCKEPDNSASTVVFSLLKNEWRGENLRHSTWKLYNDMWLNYSSVHVQFASTNYMRVTEQKKYSQTDFFGLIGGNLSLWVGINVLCILELVELVILYVQRRVKKQNVKPKFKKTYFRTNRSRNYYEKFISR